MEPHIQYARASDGVAIAYTTYGAGGMPLVCVEPPHVSHLLREWDMPWNTWQHKLERLASNRLVVRFDPRGSGLSDRGVSDHSLDARVSDLRAVVDRLGLEQFALYGVRNGSLVALKYAAEEPARVERIVLEDGFERGLDFWDTPLNRGMVALAEYVWDVFTETNARVSTGWDANRQMASGENAGDAANRLADYLRSCINQADFLAFATAELSVDLRPELARIEAPSIVLRYAEALQRGGDQDAARRLATGLRDCRYVVVDTPETYLGRLETFLGDAPETPALPDVPEAPPIGLRFILFTDIEGHTAMMARLGDERGRDVLREHERLTRASLRDHAGLEVKAMGDGFLCSFPSTQKALECAIALQQAVSLYSRDPLHGEPLRVRIGLNAGEPVAEAGDLFGTSVILAARIAGQAAGGQVLVADVVRQLSAGKGFRFVEQGERTLRGFDEAVRLWEVKWTS